MLSAASEDAFVRISRVAEMLGISTFTLKQWSKRGYGPKVIRFGPRITGCRYSDVMDFIREKERAV